MSLVNHNLNPDALAPVPTAQKADYDAILSTLQDRTPWYWDADRQNVAYGLLGLWANLLSWWKAAAKDVQASRDIDSDLSQSLYINASKNLEQIGSNVGVKRLIGEDDATYKHRIKREIFIQQSSGLIEEIKKLVSDFFWSDLFNSTNNANQIYIYNNYWTIFNDQQIASPQQYKGQGWPTGSKWNGLTLYTDYIPLYFTIFLPWSWISLAQGNFFTYAPDNVTHPNTTKAFDKTTFKIPERQPGLQALADFVDRIRAAGFYAEIRTYGEFMFSSDNVTHASSTLGFNGARLSGTIREMIQGY